MSEVSGKGVLAQALKVQVKPGEGSNVSQDLPSSASVKASTESTGSANNAVALTAPQERSNRQSGETVVKTEKDKKTGAAKKRKPGRRWTKAEDAVLKELVEKHGNRHWKRIAEAFAAKSGTERSDVQCLHRWNKCLKPGLIKGPWRVEEDEIISGMIGRYGLNNIRWSVIAKMLPGRLGKQVRERWINHLDPTIIKSEWTPEEDENLAKLHGLHGNRWKLIAQMIPGRSENGVKNRWHSMKQSNGKDKPSRAATKRKAPKTPRTAASNTPRPPQAARSTKGNNSLLGKRLVASSGESKRVDNKAQEMAKVTQHAQSLLQMSENYKLMANLMLCSNGASALPANGLANSKLTDGPLLPEGPNKRMKLSSTDVSSKALGGSFRNLLALQELSRGPSTSGLQNNPLSGSAAIGTGLGHLPNLLQMTALATAGLQPSEGAQFQLQGSTGSLPPPTDAALAQDFPHCYNMFKQLSSGTAASGGRKKKHESAYSVYI